MSSALIQAAPLKPEIRLAQKVSEFEAALSDEQKATFRSYRSQARASPPDAGDIIRLTAEVDRRAAGRGHRGRCFGPRFSNILQTIQQFAALGDAVVGGSQNIIACGIWSLVRMTLLFVANFHSYFEKLSDLLMAIGRSSPRHQMMALLYPQSKRLQSYLCEYFIVVVSLCHQHLKLIRKSTFGQLVSFLSDSDLKAYQSGTDLWASHIKDEVNALMAKDLAEQGSRTKALLLFSKSETHRKDFKTYFRILDACSAYDYQKSWKEIRKAGYTTLLDQTQEYQDWKAQTSSCTLVCTGKLGSGKSVLLANMVGDISLHVQNNPLPVAYFFCRHDTPESLQARTIMGCLARQLLGPPPGHTRLEDLTDATNPTMDFDGVVSLLLKALPPKAYIVIDGLDECDEYQAQSLLRALRQLQNTYFLLMCVSFRVEPDTASRLRLNAFFKPSFWQIPDNNPDVGQFISAELERRIISEELKMGESGLILEIENALVQGANGMFLWVALQIESLCTAKTDQAIRQALADLPKDLPTTFSRILRKSETFKDYQQRTLKLIVAARRPLTTNELREALSVTPGNIDWSPAQLINDIHSTLACCGGLIIVDEEDFAVRLVHHSVKQFLLGGLRGSSDGMFTLESALAIMGNTIVTYLSYGVFDTQLSTSVAPQVMAATAPQKIIQSSLGTSDRVQGVVLRLLKPRKQSDYDIGPRLMDEGNRSNPRYKHQFSFLPYARLHCLYHIKHTVLMEPRFCGLVLELLRKGMIDISADDADDLTLHRWATRYGGKTFGLLLEKSLGRIDIFDAQTLLLKAAKNGDELGVQLLLDEGADTEAKNSGGETPLHSAAIRGQEGIVRLLLDNGADTKAKNSEGETPLHFAVFLRHEGIVRLLLNNGAETEAKNSEGKTPLHFAVFFGNGGIVRLLLNNGADMKACNLKGETPLHSAVIRGQKGIVRLLLNNGADMEAKDRSGKRPADLAMAVGRGDIAELLR